MTTKYRKKTGHTWLVDSEKMNYMNEIKKILGLEYGQRFKIEGADYQCEL